MTSLLPALEEELRRAAERAARRPEPAPAPAPAPRTGKALRWSYVRLALAMILAFAAMVGVSAATGVITFGHPARAPSFVVRAPSEGLAGLRAADPVSGPAWELRFFRDTANRTCVQLGRVLYGQFGILGTDGRFHELSPGAFPACGGDRGGRAGDSGLLGVGRTAVRGRGDPCEAATGRCDKANTRTFAYGVLGSRVRTLTYTDPTGKRSNVPLGRYGSYLLVAAGPSPILGTLTATYDDGRTASGTVEIGTKRSFVPIPPGR
jgi:hypothetical protein